MTSLLLHIVEIEEGEEDESWKSQLDAARNCIYHFLRQQDHFYEPGNLEMTKSMFDETRTNNLVVGLSTQNGIMNVTVSSDLQTDPTIDPPGDPAQDMYMIGANDGLFELISRVSRLHSESSSGSIPSAIILSRAIAIWQDLDNWEPGCAPSPSLRAIYDIFVGTLFIWLFSVLYPDKIVDKRVQDTVLKDLVGFSEIETPGLPSLLLFPVFIHGLASVRQEDRDAIEMQFERLKAGSGLEDIDLCREVVRSCWRKYDCGVERSWDWARIVAAQGI
ncbi:hypothetical protein BBP40_002505 [Aspergillus hancockii]|nr:hypothetical protein BBP40_002505 [Aspergillus hancockii]